MSTKITKTWTAACAVAVLLAGTAACSSGGEARTAPPQRPAGAAKSTAKDTASACAGGAFLWFNVEQRDVLTGVTEKQTLGKGGGALTHRPARLHTPRTGVTTETGPEADARATLRSLGAHIGGDGEDSAFSEPSRPAPKLDGGRTSVTGAGTFVEFSYVRQVTADFRHTCADGTASTGRATSWTVDGSGVLDCAEPSKGLQDSAPGLAAARLSCDPGAPAVKAP
ncbi:hypothetical protein [Streptomyces sp. CC208A]|uniref:hypothetical protein n=1 Tax=Streptomyces sp. CC208A TaxID=3044573 RepID=UPI0024A7D7A2|nr:hypothetical protein [Streptomyces sp. CC208A]